MADDDYLTADEFERLRRRTETYREELVVLLAGRVGLRASELVRVRPGDLRERERGGETHYLLDVPEGDGGTRTAYAPREVAHALRQFANANGVADDDPLVDVSTRRVQMLVRAVTDRTDDLGDVTCRDLRKHFAHRHLVEEGVDPRVVQAVGGWASLESLAPYLDAPSRATVVDAFADGAAGDALPATEDRRRGREPRRDGDDPRLDCAASLGEALADAASAEEVERALCDRLADVYRAVWVCDEDGTVRASAASTDDGGRTGDATATGRAVPTAAVDAVDPSDGSDDLGVTVVDDVATDGPPSRRSVAVAPVRSRDAVHGLLCVAHDSFGPGDRTLLADAGRRAGRAVTAIARKRLLLADTGVELSLRTSDERAFLAAASADLDCRFELDGVVPVEDRSLLYFVTASGAAVGDVLDRVADADAVDDARLIRDRGERALFEFAVSGESVATVLVERGGTVRELAAEDGRLDVSGVFSREVDVRRVVEAVEASFPDTDLRSKREVETPTRSAAGVRETVRDRLTERQRSVLRAAYLAGYFEWPRGSTAEELAASMDVSSPTLHNHLRKAEQKVLDAVFDEAEGSAPDAGPH
ncbi:bacterio-opsin activator domain-containing protein [Halorussus halobius]|uniref:bacterio-opsin activator domain-containing protein n=1 Tax=Halorussus halobius TaxID=1710537 RepID=UPI001091A867|nr:bacterio-opsin activator domain-containing protein [Halorussus halobius]